MAEFARYDNLCLAVGETCDVADLNGDYLLDVVDFVHSASPGLEGAIFVALSNASMSFAPAAMCAASGFCKRPGRKSPNGATSTTATKGRLVTLAFVC
ncbi:hypothetical protein ACIBBG_33815 [Micromonospora chersina]|uniref:hypothetical protein n=1 Tax=Micromonospora chersina TaxID=47854 RepID=UPI0037BA931F